jgi:hypothetical protein
MKKLILGLALLVAFAVVPAIAGDFQALRNLPDQEQMALNTMTNEQLAVVVGAVRIEDILINASEIEVETGDITQAVSQTSTVSQTNNCTNSTCGNSATVTQAVSQIGVAVEVNQANVRD